MKKKILIILSLILIIVAVIGTMYLIDRNRMKNNEPVIFSTWGYDYAPPVSINYGQNNDQDYIVLNSAGITKLIEYDVEAREFNSGLEELEKLVYPDLMSLSRAVGVYVRSHIEQTEYNDLHDISLFYDGDEKNINIYMSMLEEPLTDYKDATYENNFKESIINRNEVVILHNENLDKVNNKIYYTCIFKYQGVHFVVETINLSQEEVVLLVKSIFDCDMKSIIKQKTDEKFELTFHERKDLGIKKIVSKKENGFDIYSFAGDVTIRVGSKEYDLREAILNHIIRMEEIIQKAEKDSNIGKEIQCLVSGGSNNVYRYKNYIIMDYTPADGDRAVYIGVPYMKLNDVI